jgi:hypothetical protein
MTPNSNYTSWCIIPSLASKTKKLGLSKYLARGVISDPFVDDENGSFFYRKQAIVPASVLWETVDVKTKYLTLS